MGSGPKTASSTIEMLAATKIRRIAAAVTVIDRATYYLINSYGGGLAAWTWLSVKYHFKPALKKVVDVAKK